MSLPTESRITRTTASTGTATHTRYTTATGVGAVAVVVWWIRVWRWVVPVARRVAGRVRDTVTPGGWLAIAALAALPVGLALGWIELVVAGLIGAALLVLAIPFLLGGTAYEVELQLTAERVVAGDTVTGSVRVRNTSPRVALPGRLEIPAGRGIAEVHVPLLFAGHAHVQQLTIAADHRGIIAVGPVTSVRSDPIGLLRREVEWVDLRDIYVHPVTTPIPSTSAGFIRDLEGNPSRSIVDSDISFHAIREYATGDAQRNVHWKSTAKTGTLMVRQFEETRRSRLAIVLDLQRAQYRSDDEFELGVSIAGSLGVRAIRDDRDLAVVMSDEIPEFMRRAVHTITSLRTTTTRALLDDLTAISSFESVMPLETVCSLAAEVVTDLSIAIIVCGSATDARRLQSVAVKFPRDVVVLAIVCDLESEPVHREFGGMRMMSIAMLDDLAHLMVRATR